MAKEMSVYALRKAAAESKLDELDPDWREHFLGDWERALNFYKPIRTTGLGRPFDPPDVIDGCESFDES